MVELQPWLDTRLAEPESLMLKVPKDCASARMLLSVVNAWNCILVKANSKKVRKGEMTKKEIIDDCKNRIKKVNCYKDFKNTM